MGLAVLGGAGAAIASGGWAIPVGMIMGGAGGNYAGKKHVKKVKKNINAVEFEGADKKPNLDLNGPDSKDQ
jgi:hypothetical protein